MRSLDRNCICIHTPLLPSLLEAHASWGLAFFFFFNKHSSFSVLLGGIGKEGRGDEVRFTTASFLFNDSLMRFVWVLVELEMEMGMRWWWNFGGTGIADACDAESLPCSWHNCRSRGCRCCRDYDDMKIMLLACLLACQPFACMREIRICVCVCVKKKKDPEDPEKDPEAVRGLPAWR